MTSTDLVHQCFGIFSRIPLSMVKSSLDNSPLLSIKIPALGFNCSYASSVIKKFRNPLTVCGIRLHLRVPHTNFADSTYISRNAFTVAESRTASYIRLLRNPRHNKWADKIYFTGVCTRNPRKLKVCLWNPGRYRHKTDTNSTVLSRSGRVMCHIKTFAAVI